MKKNVYLLLFLFLCSPLITVAQSDGLVYTTDTTLIKKFKAQLNNRSALDSIAGKLGGDNKAGLTPTTNWEGTATGVPPLQGEVTVPSKVRISISGSSVSGYLTNGPYPNGAYGAGPFSGSITSGSLNQNTLTFDCWGEPTLPWTMTETTLTGFYGAQPGSGNVGPIPQFRFNLTRIPDATVAHFHQIVDNPAFSTRKLLGQIPLASRVNAFTVCADGSQVSIFAFSGGDIDYSAAVVKIYEDVNNEPDRYGSFTVLSQNAKGIEVRYKHPLHLPVTSTSIDLNLVLYIPSNGNLYHTLRVINAPVIMVHGFNVTKPDGFELMERELVFGGWPRDLLYRPYYGPTSNKNFSVNSNVIPDAINTVITQSIFKGYATGKVSVVGHSMGGLLTRVYLQSSSYRNDIYKIITLNTPHSGAQAANLSINLSSDPSLRNMLLTLVRIYLDEGAVTDLAVDSDAIKSLNKPGNPVKQPGNLNYHTAPVHAIATTYPWSYKTPPPATLSKVPNIVGLAGMLSINLNQVLGEQTHDWVVPLSSQWGGLPGLNFTSVYPNQIHIGSMDNFQVIERTLELLHKPVNGPEFCITGYAPPALTYTRIKALSQNSTQLGKATINATVHISLPIQGKTVQGGSSLRLQATGTGIDSLWLFVSYESDSMYYGYQKGNVADMTFIIDKNEGRRSVVAMGKTTDGQFVSDTSYIYVSNNYCQTVQSGNWSNPATWSCGHEPSFLDDTEINTDHVVTIIGTGYAKRLTNRGKLIYNTGGQLRLSIAPPGSLSLSGNMNFGLVTIGQTASRTLVIKNTGIQLTITGFSLPTGYSGSWSGTLASGASQSVVITYLASTTGVFSGQLSVNSVPTATGNLISLNATSTTSTLNNGLVMYLPFTGNANDASGNGNNGVVTGPVLTNDRFGNANQAYSFVRSNGQYISVPHNAGLDITGAALSICAWVNPNWNGSGFNMQVLSKARDGSSEGRKFGLGTDSPTLMNFELRTSSGTTDQNWNCTNCNLQANTWQFVTVTYDGTWMKWYKNGALVYQVAKTGNIVSTTTDLVIGSFASKNVSFFNGSMDEIRLYNRALTDSEVLSLSQQ